MDNAKKHLEKLQKQIDVKLGQGKSGEILAGLDVLTVRKHCQGTLKSIYQFVFSEKECHMDIVETFATGGADCIFETWYTDKEA